MHALLNELYFGKTRRALKFQSLVLVFDAALIMFFVVSPFLERDATYLVLDYVLAAILGLDLAARATGFGNFKRWLRKPIVWADMAVLASLLVPLWFSSLGFLRILRAWSMFNSGSFWRVIGGGRWRNTQTETIARAAASLIVFVFMMTALVHSAFARPGSEFSSFTDSLYFTVASLTTTGYGDITLPGTGGRLLSIFIMLVGVSLFLRLVQVAIRPAKITFRCPSCGLMRHEPDAVHCKACGGPLSITYFNE
ncbi:MAG: ion transporter [Alphaproteobacteria bacterium]|nr:ion transporter [Alphaproteobacteria bacterium]